MGQAPRKSSSQSSKSPLERGCPGETKAPGSGERPRQRAYRENPGVSGAEDGTGPDRPMEPENPVAMALARPVSASKPSRLAGEKVRGLRSHRLTSMTTDAALTSNLKSTWLRRMHKSRCRQRHRGIDAKQHLAASRICSPQFQN